MDWEQGEQVIKLLLTLVIVVMFGFAAVLVGSDGSAQWRMIGAVVIMLVGTFLALASIRK